LEPDFIFVGLNWDKAVVDHEPGAEHVWPVSTEWVVIRDWNDDYCN
jgi:hypothetical protein